MRPRISLLLWVLCLLSAASPSFAKAADDAPPRHLFFAFQNGVSFGPNDREAATLKELGYDGISQVKVTGAKLAEKVAAYDKVGLRVLSVYLNVNDKPLDAALIKPLANRGAMVELTVRKMTPTTVEAVRKTAEMASKLKVRVALYPHHGFAIAKIPQALELIEKVDHPNLGVMFNLCHFLKGEKAEDLEAVLKRAQPHLFSVSTSGANLGGKNWGDLIKPLDSGDFPQLRLFKALKGLKFKGPVGLQCYGVRGDKRTNLKRSIAAWKKIESKLASDEQE